MLVVKKEIAVVKKQKQKVLIETIATPNIVSSLLKTVIEDSVLKNSIPLPNSTESSTLSTTNTTETETEIPITPRAAFQQ